MRNLSRAPARANAAASQVRSRSASSFGTFSVNTVVRKRSKTHSAPVPRTRLGQHPTARPRPGSGLWRIRHEDAAQHGAGELRRQAIHCDLVPVVSTHPMALATAPDLPEPGLFVGPPTGAADVVEREH